MFCACLLPRCLQDLIVIGAPSGKTSHWKLGQVRASALSFRLICLSLGLGAFRSEWFAV